MLADLPPSSSTQGMPRVAAAAAIFLPVAGEPTNTTFFIAGWLKEA
jgi:hypothetical protein